MCTEDTNKTYETIHNLEFALRAYLGLDGSPICQWTSLSFFAYVLTIKHLWFKSTFFLETRKKNIIKLNKVLWPEQTVKFIVHNIQYLKKDKIVYNNYW